MRLTDAVAEVLRLRPEDLDQHWREADAAVAQLPAAQQSDAWKQILSHIALAPISKGHPYFRLGVLHLRIDPSEKQAITYLEKAFREDQDHAREVGRLAHRMGAYRLLALCKGFFEYLGALKPKDWQVKQLEGLNRKVLIETILGLYDLSLTHPIETQTYTYQTFFALVQDRKLCAFAIENYFCAEELIEKASLQSGQALLHRHEYPLARAITGLIGGVLEAILADRLPLARGQTLGGLINEGNKEQIILPGTRIAALSSLMLYLRNHIHADRASSSTEYYIDINVANGCKVALDWAVGELLADGGPTTKPSG